MGAPLHVVPEYNEELSAARARVQAYADAIRNGEAVLDLAALERAEDLALLYETKVWVTEVEPPKNKVYRGRPVDPESRNRFAGWALTSFGLNPRYTKYLFQAHDWRANYGNRVPLNRLTEKAIRSSYALERKGYGERTPEVMKRAAELAGEAGSATITQAHVKQAVGEFWATIPRPEQRKIAKSAVAKRHATIARTNMMWLIDNGYFGDLAELLIEVNEIGSKAAEAL